MNTNLITTPYHDQLFFLVILLTDTQTHKHTHAFFIFGEAGCLLTIPCCLTCTVITEAGTLLTTPCFLTCTMITEVGSLLTTP